MKRLKKILQSKYTYIILFIFLGIYVLLFTRIIKYNTKISDNIIEGIVISVDVSEKGITFILKNKEKIRCTYYENDFSNFKNILGKNVRIIGKKQDINNNTIPNAFNYKKYLYNNKIYLSMNISKIEILKEENIFYKFKNYIIKEIESFDDPVKTYLNLFIIGNKDLLNSNMYNTYRNNGIWHLFAISGTHINLIVLILHKLLKKVKFKNVLISAILFYFMFLTNYSASVLRVTIFYYLKEFLKLFNINLGSVKILFLTAFIILLINPFMIYSAGFQYSFLITLSILLESKYIRGNYITKIFKISLISFVVSIPITVNMNYKVNLTSVFLNVLYVPFISFFVFPVSIITFLIPMLSGVLKLFIFILEFTNNFFANFKLCVTIPKMSILIIFMYYIITYLWYKFRNKVYLLFLLIPLFISDIVPKINNNYQITFFDVGQGDSSIIIAPFQKDIVVIDTGGLVNSDYNISDNVIVYLKSIGINKINKLILTHGDYDHMGEAINLVENFKVEKVIFNCGQFNELEQDLIKVLDKNKIPYYSCIKELNIDKNKLYFLNSGDYGNENDNSSVIYTELNNHKFLFMGDAGIEVEEDLIEKYNLQNIDILKVGHHGSRTSSSKEFISEINPRYSIISVGKNNRYGHPNNNVLDNLNNSKIYRTDQDGSIMFKIKNDKLKIETSTP